jgi:hypothetical protein
MTPALLCVLLPFLCDFARRPRPVSHASPGARHDDGGGPLMVVAGVTVGLVPIFKGWNVWQVWQVKDLDFSPLMVGVSRDTQLRIWVEDAVRLGDSNVEVADPIDFKGSHVEILVAPPTGLAVAKADDGTPLTKDHLPGDPLLVETQDEAPELRSVRFFNRGPEGRIVWPHDDNYLLDAVFQPDPKNPLTAGPGPRTIGETVKKPVTDAALDVGLIAAGVAVAAVLAIALLRFASRRAVA